MGEIEIDFYVGIVLGAVCVLAGYCNAMWYMTRYRKLEREHEKRLEEIRKGR